MRISNVAARAAADAVAVLLNGGTVEIRTGAPPATVEDTATGTLLATLSFANPAFAAASDTNPGARALANSITGDTAADANGLAGWFRAKTSGGVAVIDGTVGGVVQATDGEMMFANAQFVQGAAIEALSYGINHPE